MAKTAFARRYAQAAFEIASQRKELDKWLEDLKRAAGIFQTSELAAFLESPKVDFSEKARIVARLLSGFDPLELNFIFVLVQRERLHLLPEIVDEYGRFLNQVRGIETAEVTTAVALGDAERQSLEKRLSQTIGKKIIMTTQVDPNIVGGMVAHVGGKLIDGSVRTKLETLKKEIGGRAG